MANGSGSNSDSNGNTNDDDKNSNEQCNKETAAAADNTKRNDDDDLHNPKNLSTQKPYITIKESPIYFTEQWSKGTGGGLWSTALAMASYFQTHNMTGYLQRIGKYKEKKRICALELGSANGFLAICLAAAVRDVLEELVVTDVGDQLEFIRENIGKNGHVCVLDGDEDGAAATTMTTTTTTEEEEKTDNTTKVKTIVMEHQFGNFHDTNDTTNNNSNNQTLEHQIQTGTKKFDFIFASDIASESSLYQPIIQSLLKLSHAYTVSLVGVTMEDTKPQFFTDLRVAGFRYERIADCEMDVKFRGNLFGIFVIWKRKGGY